MLLNMLNDLAEATKASDGKKNSKAYRGLPEARMAGATVEETAFEDVNMWQAPPPS